MYRHCAQVSGRSVRESGVGGVAVWMCVCAEFALAVVGEGGRGCAVGCISIGMAMN